MAALEPRVRPEVFRTWCRDLDFIQVDENVVHVPAPNAFYRDWLERDLRRPLEEAFLIAFGRVPELVFRVREDGGVDEPPLDETRHAEAPAPPRVPSPEAPTPIAPVPALARTADGSSLPLNPAYTFEVFVAGPTNRLAHAAALAVSETPGRDHNPLFIHGGVGLGKTHLLQAVCHATLARNPFARIIYLSCESFVNDYISAMQKKQFETFRARYRGADLLVIDDIHFLAGKDASQEEFFHTFNALHGAQRQIVLSSDSTPRDIKALSERLVSRFLSGCVARVDTPTFEMRVAILRRKAEVRGFELPADVAAFVASRITTNIRELDGAVNRITFYRSLTGRTLDLDLAQEALHDLSIAPSAVQVRPAQIVEAVSRYYGKKPDVVTGRTWSKSTSRARQVAMYLCKRLTPLSLTEIGATFGKDHSTVLYAIRRVEEMLASDPAIKAEVDALSRQLISG